MKHLIAALCCTLALSACSGGQSEDGNVLARFDGGVITSEDVSARLQSMQRNTRFRDTPELLTPEFAFEHVLNMEMIIAKGKAEQLHRDPHIRNALHEHMSSLFLKLMENDLITTIDRDAITEEELLAFYEEHLNLYQEHARYTLRAFSVAPEQIEAATAALREEELSFAEAAERYAAKEEERTSGGMTGTRTLQRFQPSWQPIVEHLVVGEIAGPEVIDDTTYFLLLESKTEARQHSFEDRKSYIRNDVLYNRYRDQWRQVYEDLREQFQVRIDEARLAEFYENAAAGR
ncbi:peptidyl-prolyl cis-trans isomerase [Desulfobulbus alkaliphilus]|uniref:peptidylprolyl isomerase n=1 Tax=Desulfobulbus alkaliphilus TaxID=869814 RepID=UPI001962582E|nr:peptidylprolyl isomerase [Desulfobulbus alkaliphilus]MBM9536580.1 peptidyl-prolyl cis-trans isomerase [Desulfobulbus alkaliphilus]